MHSLASTETVSALSLSLTHSLNCTLGCTDAKVNWSPRFHVHFPKDSVRDPIETLLILHLSIRDHDSDEYSYIPRFPECPVHTLPLELLWMIAEWVVICVRYDVLTPTLETSNG